MHCYPANASSFGKAALDMISPLPETTMEAIGEAAKIGHSNLLRAAHCPRTPNSCECGKHSGAKIFLKSRLRTARMLYPVLGALKCLPRSPPKKTSFFTFLRLEI